MRGEHKPAESIEIESEIIDRESATVNIDADLTEEEAHLCFTIRDGHNFQRVSVRLDPEWAKDLGYELLSYGNAFEQAAERDES